MTDARPPSRAASGEVLRCSLARRRALSAALAPLGLRVAAVGPGRPIPGSFWGDCEAGLRGDYLHLRADTPIHSALHEAGHYACMDGRRRAGLDTHAGGDGAEEIAVCYWQVLATDWLDGIDRARMCADMDRWGYSFRLGSAAAWFAEDAEDARAWLLAAGLLDPVADRLHRSTRG